MNSCNRGERSGCRSLTGSGYCENSGAHLSRGSKGTIMSQDFSELKAWNEVVRAIVQEGSIKEKHCSRPHTRRVCRPGDKVQWMFFSIIRRQRTLALLPFGQLPLELAEAQPICLVREPTEVVSELRSKQAPSQRLGQRIQCNRVRSLAEWTRARGTCSKLFEK